MFKSIVVGTDGTPRSEQAVTAAAELAKVHGATLHLVQAYRPSMSAVGGATVAGDAMVAMASSTDDELHKHVEGQLGRMKGQIERSGVSVNVHATPVAAAAAILAVADDTDADLIVVGSKGMQGARRVLGSVPNSIAHQAKCTVMIVNTD